MYENFDIGYDLKMAFEDGYRVGVEAAQPRWIRVEADLPAHAITPCLIYADGTIDLADWSYDKYGLEWWFYVDGEYETGVTHWMPLPAPPKEGE